MTYPDYKTYTKLYGRYLTKSIQPFFDGVNLHGKRVLDLCAGGGQLSQYAIDNGASEVVMVDSAPQMLNPNFDGKYRTVQIDCDVRDFIDGFRSGLPYTILTTHNGTHCYEGGMPNEEQFDVMVCRQAINYWINEIEGEELAKLLKKEGMFAFNTFGNKPSKTPTVREYFHGGIPYKEISYLVGGKVHHVQTAEGMTPHVTTFDWIDREEIRKKLSPCFHCQEVVDGPSSMWYCWKL